MKVRQNRLKDLKKLGFVKVIREKNTPIFDFVENMDIDKFNKLYALKDKYYEDNYVVEDDYDCLYYHEGSWVFEIGHSRRGQSYYVIIHKVTNEVQILATEPDGAGGVIDAGNIFKELIESDFII
tara:strand:+ start:1082 stop:1456 length:375 start_codon:yes stop_codon:yes gene_type:complete